MSKAFDCALRLLARREHGAYELSLKLRQKGFSEEESTKALAKCQDLDLQSERRYVASLCNTRIRQGYGSEKIKNDLKAKKIDRDLIDEILQEHQENWVEYAHDVRKKKYKTELKPDFTELQKQKQFLLYRGFSMDVIAKVFN